MSLSKYCFDIILDILCFITLLYKWTQGAMVKSSLGLYNSENIIIRLLPYLTDMEIDMGEKISRKQV